ncbi:MAG: HD domain-containing protein [Deltaproteobacteria bacterium]
MNYLSQIAKMIDEQKRKIIQNGGNIYLVGGSVRDIIMENMGILPKGIKPKDFDFCVTGLSQLEFESIFPAARIQGKDFPVYVLEELPGCEISLARKERKVAKGYRGFKIITSPDVTIEQDLIRRDFTINSIAYDFYGNKIIDLFNGNEDIKNRILRAASPAFGEDPLRVYRAAQMAARFGFDVEPKTIRMMNELKDELYTISPERIFEELRKAIRTKQPSRFFKVLNQAGVLTVHFPEIAKLVGVEQPVQYHPEGDAFNHTMIVFDKVAEKTQREEVIFAGLVHDVGKGVTSPSLWPRHIGHEKAGAALIAEMGRRLKLPKTWGKAGKVSAGEHMKASRFEEMRPAKKVEFIEKISRSVLGLEGLEIITNADGNNIRFAELGRKMLEEVNGRILGLKEGKEACAKIHEARVKWIKNLTENLTSSGS